MGEATAAGYDARRWMDECAAGSFRLAARSAVPPPALAHPAFELASAGQLTFRRKVGPKIVKEVV